MRVYCAPGLSKASTSMMEAMATPCWQVEEFVVSAECFQCNTFQQKLWRECSSTGYVEKINCTKSNKDEYKSIQTREEFENVMDIVKNVQLEQIRVTTLSTQEPHTAQAAVQCRKQVWKS
ncbi:hypothetical protein Z043_101915 [Scleropages formosus]|uniref:Protein JTB n=1 Tax=Scleropages formosus TaxID=113540 RepID=A0A0P7VQP2_SCLFO|nr:hypothetical protein Z043_101915 [Scleropages formosus]